MKSSNQASEAVSDKITPLPLSVWAAFSVSLTLLIAGAVGLRTHAEASMLYQHITLFLGGCGLGASLMRAYYLKKDS